MPFEKGNKEAANKGLYQSALKRALARSGKTVDGGLNKVADKLVKAAEEGEQWAIKEIGDRIDGKAAQSMTLAGDAENPLFIAEATRPELTKEEWLEKHGIE